MAADPELVFNEAQFKADFQRIMGNALREAGMIAMQIMTRNVMSLPVHDFKGEFKQEVASKISMKVERMTDSAMKMLAGLVDDQSDEWFMIRASILEYGMGYMADPAGGGSLEPVQHTQGVAGINDTVTGYAPVSDRESFLLPDSWNHPPGYWFKDSAVMLDEIFDEILTQAVRSINILHYFEKKGDWTVRWELSL